MGNAPTARDYVNVHRVDAACPHCDPWRELDLAALIAARQGDLPLIPPDPPRISSNRRPAAACSEGKHGGAPNYDRLCRVIKHTLGRYGLTDGNGRTWARLFEDGAIERDGSIIRMLR